jgi:hypothetical protein
MIASEAKLRFRKVPQESEEQQLGIMMTDEVMTEEEEKKQKDMFEQREFERNLIMDFNKQTKETVASMLAANEVIRCEKEPATKNALINDFEDFKEIKEHIMNANGQTSADAMMIDTSSTK